MISPSQVIHGDLLHNILLWDGHPPAVIDWPPYHRPAAFAKAIAVTDAVTFDDVPLRVLDQWADGPDWQQLLIRALLYRVGTSAALSVESGLTGGLLADVERVAPVIDAVLARTG